MMRSRLGGLLASACAISVALLGTKSAAAQGTRVAADPASRPASSLIFYVATNGNDRWSGTSGDPTADGTDGPFLTLERARDAVRQIKPDARGVTIMLRGGEYLRSQTFALEAQDGGAADRPIVYRSSPGERARLIGGRPISGFVPVTDPAMLDRLDPAARGHVLQIDLKARGISDYGALSPRGFHRPMRPSPLEVFFRGKPMPLARWPDHGFATISRTPAGPNAGRFDFDNERLARWAAAPDLWLHGYWMWDWADSYEKVKSINLDKHEIVTEAPHGVYGYAPNRRFVVLNAPDELNAPGEWYLDRQAGLLYFWPPDEIHDGDVTISMLSTPIVEVHGASYVTFRELSFECGRAEGAVLIGGSHNRIAGCSFLNLGTIAVSLGDKFQNLHDDLYHDPLLNRDSGFDNGIISCDIAHTGEGGIALGGGDRRTLVAGGNFAINNRITDYARWVRTYRPAIFIDGVGNHVAHNDITDAPHCAILLRGNDHVVEYNRISHVCAETADVGAFYMGRDYTERGNVVRFNLFDECGGPAAFSTDTNAIYLDDWASGALIYGNIAFKCGRGVKVGGGRDNIIENNLLIDCDPAIFIDARGLEWSKTFTGGSETVLFDRLKLVRFDQPPYSRRYPLLAGIRPGEAPTPGGNKVIHNVRDGGNWLRLPEHGDMKMFTIRDNFTEGDPQVINPDKRDFRLAPASAVWNIGFRPIPADKIGLQRDEYRPTLPATN